MTFVEFLVVYLSAGAPFGVLVFFSRTPKVLSSTAILRGFGASLIWPLLALSWSHRKLISPKSFIPARSAKVDAFDADAVVAEYLTLTRALAESKRSALGSATELFDISGHSDPKLGAICHERRRNSQLARRQADSSMIVRRHVPGRYSNDAAFMASLALECRRLDDHETADVIELGSQPIRSIPAESPAPAVKLAA